jgi:hypothetical protein
LSNKIEDAVKPCKYLVTVIDRQGALFPNKPNDNIPSQVLIYSTLLILK